MGDTIRYLSQNLLRHRWNRRSVSNMGMRVRIHLMMTLIPKNLEGKLGSSPGENGSDVVETTLIVQAAPLLLKRVPPPVLPVLHGSLWPARCGQNCRTAVTGQFRPIGPDSVTEGLGLLIEHLVELGLAAADPMTAQTRSQANKIP